MKKAISTVISAVIGGVSVMPAAASAAEAPHRFTSSFIQNWYCRDWTEARWEQEFTAAKAAGFDSLILQSTYDIVRGDCTGEKQDAAAYPAAESFCMFPSATSAAYHSSQNSGDALALALEAAKATDMKLWLGTVNDDMWWKYGWGAPTSYFEGWSADNAELCGGLVTEMWERYGADYGEQIAGWYYTSELWNIDAACDGSDGGKYARIIGENIAATVTAIEQSCHEKPLIVSPFYNTDISTAEQFGGFIGDVIEAAGLRSIDIYAPQDGGGREYATDVIREWVQAQKAAVDGRMRFWINTESFGEDMTAKPIANLRADYAATADLAEENIIFSWNHYYASDSALNRQFTEFAADSLQGDVNLDGQFTVADMVTFQRWLLGAPDANVRDREAADFCADGRLDTFDLCLMRKALVAAQNEEDGVVVSTVAELRNAVKNAKAGDVIRVAAGTYDCGSQKLYSEADGTADKPIKLAALDPDSPPVLTGANTEHGYVLHITGDYWIV
ncbi:MAG: DUF4434 domain-containing protein, partial [Ruminococcus sp.]|nr:DUF4434 domain-containing protein [Ruminococcus sp.]